MAEAEGLIKQRALEEAGFTSEELAQWRSETSRTLMDSGFSGQEIDDYFGVKNPDMKPMQKYFEGNLQKLNAPKAVEPSSSLEALPGAVPTEQAPKLQGEEPKKATTFLEALEAGWDMSVSGLLAQKKLPDVMLPEDAPTYMRIASQVSTLAGDVPAMIAGAAGGGAIGSSVPVVGSAIGAGAGAFAAPAAIRETLMQHYEKGDIQDFQDFWERASAVFIETGKGAAIGAATAGVGGFVAKGVAGVAAPAAVKTASTLASEVATMVTVGKALEGEMPNAQDFLDAGILIGGLKGSTAIAGKLRNIYAKTGIKSPQVAEQAMQDPVVLGEMLSSNIEVPKAYEPLVEKPKTNAIEKTEPVKAVESEATKTGEQTPQEKILSQVGEQGEGPKKPGYTWDKFYKDWVDKLDPIKKATEKLSENPSELSAAENPYALSRMANDYTAKTKHFIEKAPLDFKTLEAKGKGLKQIIEPHKSELADLDAYLISRRVVELEGRGIKSGFDLEAAKSVVKGGKKFEAAAKEMVDFQNQTLTYLKDSGVLSKDSFNAMKEANQAYLPFKRIMEMEEVAKGGKGKASSLKEIKGSDRKIQSPMLSIMENTEALLQMAEKNRAVETFITMAEKSGQIGAEGLVEKVPNRMKAIEVKAEEIAKELKKQGIEADPEAFNIFRPQSKNLAPNEFEVFRNGKREVYKTTPELAEAFKALDGDGTSMNMLMRFARGITTVKKLGIAFTPEFILRNVFRDQITAGTFTKGGAVPFTDMFAAMGDLVKKNDVYYNWLKSGGANGSFMELNQKYLEKNVFELNKQTGFLDKTWNLVQKPVEVMRVAAELTEQATRLAEFKRVTRGESSGAKIFEGGMASREVTVDFQRMGAKMSALNAITAFQNISVQGLDRSLRALKENPSGVALKSAAYMTVPSVLLWWANKDDPRWKEIPRWQKDMFWIIMTEDTVYRLPKPQELGILFGSLPERALEAFFTDNPKAMTDFDETLGELVTPALVPDAISPVMEQYFNKSLFTGNPIVPRKFESLLPQYQYSEYTSETGKLLGKFIATVPGLNSLGTDNAQLQSPAVIDNYLRSWGGTLGQYAIQLADKALAKTGVVPDPVKPADTLADIPFVKAFVIRYPSAGAQSLMDFYENHEENKRVADTIRHLARQGDFENLTKELTLQENQDKLVTLDSIKDALTAQAQFVRLVQKNPDMTRDEKRQAIDGAYYQMIEAAKMGNEMFKELKDAMKEKGN